MKIKIQKVADRMIGFRVSSEIYQKLENIAEREESPVSTIVRAIIEQVIDTVE